MIQPKRLIRSHNRINNNSRHRSSKINISNNNNKKIKRRKTMSSQSLNCRQVVVKAIIEVIDLQEQLRKPQKRLSKISRRPSPENQVLKNLKV